MRIASWILLVVAAAVLTTACAENQAETDAVIRSLRGVAASVQVEVDNARDDADTEAAGEHLRDALADANLPEHVTSFVPGSRSASGSAAPDQVWVATTVIVNRKDADPFCAVVGAVARRPPVVEIRYDVDHHDPCEDVEAEIDPDAGT